MLKPDTDDSKDSHVGYGSTISVGTYDTLTIGQINNRSSGAYGGIVNLYGHPITVPGGISNICPYGTGGSVYLNGGDISVAGGVNNQALMGGGFVGVTGLNVSIPTGINNDCSNGPGGSVQVTTYVPSGLTLGAGGPFKINDNAKTDGGTVSVTNFGPLTYNGGIQASSGHNGSTIVLTVAYSPGIPSGGALIENANLDVSGNEVGVGGNITLLSDNAAANGCVTVNGNLTANAGPSGASAGTVTINGSNNAAGSPAVIVNGNITANSQAGTGGRVSLLVHGANSAVVNSGKIEANGGTGGGNVSIDTTDGITLNGTSITANGTGAVANGGTIAVTDGGVIPPSGGGPVTVNCSLMTSASA